MTLSHAQALDLFSAYLEADLDAERMTTLEGHLSDCSECRDELQSLEDTLSLVQKVSRVSAPPDFVRRVKHRVRQRSGGRYFGIRAAATRVPFEIVSFALIVMVLALYVLMLLSGPVAPK